MSAKLSGMSIDTLPSFRSKRGHYLWNATLMPFYAPEAEMLSLRDFLCTLLELGTGLAFSVGNKS
jgi:hypothetical protein